MRVDDFLVIQENYQRGGRSRDDSNDLIIFSAIAQGTVDDLRCVIGCGCDVNHLDRHGASPLMYAIQMHNTSHVRVLLQYGAILSDAVLNRAWVEAKTGEAKPLEMLEYLIVYHDIPIRERKDIPVRINERLANLLMKIRARIARCQRTCLAWLVGAQWDKRLRALVAKPLAVRIARAVWETRRQRIWWQ